VTEKLKCHCQWRRRPRRKMHLLPSSIVQGIVYRFRTASRLTNMQDLDGDASPTACQETGWNRTFPVPRTWKSGALTASTAYMHIKLHILLRYVLTFAFQFLCSFRHSPSFEPRSFPSPALFFIRWHLSRSFFAHGEYFHHALHRFAYQRRC